MPKGQICMHKMPAAVLIRGRHFGGKTSDDTIGQPGGATIVDRKKGRVLLVRTHWDFVITREFKPIWHRKLCGHPKNEEFGRRRIHCKIQFQHCKTVRKCMVKKHHCPTARNTSRTFLSRTIHEWPIWSHPSRMWSTSTWSGIMPQRVRHIWQNLRKKTAAIRIGRCSK